MKTKYSPGPWEAERHGKTQQFTISQTATKPYGSISGCVYGENNARLISAAPELLEALEKAVSAASYVVRLCEATDKAGQSASPTEKADWIGTVAHCYAAMAFVSEARAAIAKATTPNLTK